MNPHMQQRPGKEQGSVLLVTMVFLLLFAIVATSVFRGSQTSVQAVGNMQWRSEAIQAINEATASILSDFDGFIEPALTKGLSAPDAPSGKFSSDVNGDGKADIAVNVDAVQCTNLVPVPVEDLDETNPEDIKCLGIGFCNEAQFFIQLTATDPVSSANVQIEQGVGVRVADADLCKL